jgi:hypothetical protein
VRGNDDSLTGNLKSKIAMAGELILIIEDNEKNRKLARDVLQVKGYRGGDRPCSGTIAGAYSDGHSASGHRRYYGAEAAPIKSEDQKHSGHRDHRVSDDTQPADDVGGRFRWLSDQTD